jgi:hypothetical protein
MPAFHLRSEYRLAVRQSYFGRCGSGDEGRLRLEEGDKGSDCIPAVNELAQRANTVH